MKVTLDGRSDQYGLAVTVFQVLTNWRYPIDDTTIGPIFMAKLGLAPMRHPVEHDPRIPQAVSDAVMRALATDRERRFSSSVEFAETVLGGFGLGERRAIGPHSSAVKPTPVAFEPAPAPVQPAAPPEPSFDVRENSLGMRLVQIPAGLFTMGANDGDADEKPVRVVRITKQFLLGQTEVSQQQFTTIMGATPWRGRDDAKHGPTLAASYVSWNDAVEFCRRLTDMERREGTLPAGRVYRLPTEAEWEYACRAGTTTRFSFGDDEARLGEFAWCDANAGGAGEGHAHEVGRKSPNPWGLHDMHGNVSEWCSDWYATDYYATAPAVDPQGPAAGLFRVIRGGSWFNSPIDCRAAFRGNATPINRYFIVGFRVVCELE